MRIKDDYKGILKGLPNLNDFEEMENFLLENDVMIDFKDYRTQKLRNNISQGIQLLLLWRSENSSFYERTRDYIWFYPQEDADITKDLQVDTMYNVCVNYIYILASSFCNNPKQMKEIEDIYEKYEKWVEPILLESKYINKDTVISSMIPREYTYVNNLAIALLEAMADDNISEKREEYAAFEKKLVQDYNDSKVVGVGRFQFDISSSQEWGIPEEVQEEIFQDILRILKKYNKKIYRNYKAIGNYNIIEDYSKVFFNIQEGKQGTMNVLKMAQEVSISFVFCKVLGCIEDEEMLLEKMLYIFTLIESVYNIEKNAKNKVNKSVTLDETEKGILGNLSMALSTPLFLHLKHQYSLTDELLLYNQEIEKEDITRIINIYREEKGEDFEKDDFYYQYFDAACNMILIMKNYNSLNHYYQDVMQKLFHSKKKKMDKLLEENEASMEKLKAEKNSEIAALKEQIKSMKMQVESLTSQVEEKERELKREISKHEQIEENKKELEGLREYVYTQSEEAAEQEVIDITDIRKNLSGLKICIIGGRPSWSKKLELLFPEWQYVPMGNNSFPEKCIQNAELVLINDSFCKHSAYYKAISLIEKSDAQLGFVGNFTNVNLTIEHIHKVALQKNLIKK